MQNDTDQLLDAANQIILGNKAWAFMEQRENVIPEDIQAVLVAVAAGHRLRSGNNDSAAIVAPLLAKVDVH